MEAFGELPKVNKDEITKNKMQAYLVMYNKPPSSQEIVAIRALAGTNERSKMGLTKIGDSDTPGCSPQLMLVHDSCIDRPSHVSGRMTSFRRVVVVFVAQQLCLTVLGVGTLVFGSNDVP